MTIQIKIDEDTRSAIEDIEQIDNHTCNDSVLLPDKDFLTNDWDVEKFSNSSPSICSIKEPSCTQVEHSFDTDCSFRPDEDFVDADWDS